MHGNKALLTEAPESGLPCPSPMGGQRRRPPARQEAGPHNHRPAASLAFWPRALPASLAASHAPVTQLGRKMRRAGRYRLVGKSLLLDKRKQAEGDSAPLPRPTLLLGMTVQGCSLCHVGRRWRHQKC